MATVRHTFCHILSIAALCCVLHTIYSYSDRHVGPLPHVLLWSSCRTSFFHHHPACRCRQDQRPDGNPSQLHGTSAHDLFHLPDPGTESHVCWDRTACHSQDSHGRLHLGFLRTGTTSLLPTVSLAPLFQLPKLFLNLFPFSSVSKNDIDLSLSLCFADFAAR